MAIFTGAGVAIITPFTEDLEVDYEKLEEIIEDQIAGSTDAIVICGTTGEASTLSHEEHLETIRFTVEKTAKRVPVIAGSGSNCTKTAVFLSKEAEAVGADGVLVVTPYYNKATQKGLMNHFTEIANAINIPLLMYNIPGRTGCTMTPETIATLFHEVDNIVGIKEASGDISHVAQVMQLTDGKIDLYSGNDDQIVPLLSLGGRGVISVLSNVAPKETHDIVEKYLNGDVKGSLEIQLRALPLIHNLFAEVNPIPVKKAMNLMGMKTGSLRSPLTEMDESLVPALAESMEAFGLKLV
jgi:4-hydroxy-tetrahydrodipicolinate synthase